MSRIFISHSSSDNAAAVALRDWLVASGWDDLFLDLDPQRGIAAGERWERKLNEAANRCEAVLFLVSRSWLASDWCLKEFHLATRLNKRMFGVLVEDLSLSDLPGELTKTWELVSLAAGKDHLMLRARIPPDDEEVHVTFSRSGLAKLKAGLAKAGLDPGFFEWPPKHDPDRAPYRGLKALEAEDAGIFFGREAPTIAALDRLRGLREAAPPRFLVILGASGAGKSSFLRAGLIPRFERDDRHFVALPVVRPGRSVLSGETGLIRSLEVALKQAGMRVARASLRTAVDEGAAKLIPLLQELADKGRVPGTEGEAEAKAPSLVLSIDQAEELFAGEGATEAGRFLSLLKDLVLAQAPDVIVVVTIRSDSYEQLQNARPLEGIDQKPFSLPPMPQGAYQTVIEGPARRLANSRRSLRIDPALTQRLLADIETGGGKDALPLLAFTLQRLYADYGGDGALELSEYESLGGLEGSIEAAVAAALKRADDDPAIPRDHQARLSLLRRGLIPWLAGIDPDAGSPRRQVARYHEIPEEARPLIGHLIEARLLASDVDPETQERTVEPAHEALLRQWGLLKEWLAEDLAVLTTLEGVQRATRDWLANAKDPGWLSHAAGRLEDAERLRQRDDLARKLTPDDWAYLEACRTAENDRRNRELEQARQLAEEQQKVAKRTRVGFLVASLLAAIAIAAAGYGWVKQKEAQTETARAISSESTARLNETIALAELSKVALADNFPSEAVQLAVAAWPRAGDADRPQLRRTVRALAAVLPANRERLRFSAFDAVFSPDGQRVLTASWDNTARLWDAATGAELLVLKGHEGPVTSAVFSPDGRRVLTASQDKTARLWDAATGAELLVLKGHENWVTSAVFSPDGRRVLTASGDHTARLWDAATGAELLVLKGHEDPVTSAVFSPDGRRVLTASFDHTARLWDAATGAELLVLKGHEAPSHPPCSRPMAGGCLRRLLTTPHGLWDAATGAELSVLKGHENGVTSAVFSPDGRRVLTASEDLTARLWDAATGAELLVLKGHEGSVNSAVFSPDGRRVLTASADLTARLWDAATGAEMLVLKGHEGPVKSAVFSPDGRRVLTASDDKTARLWDAATGAELSVLKGHESSVNSAVFSPDGQRVLTASDHHTTRLWDAATGAELSVLKGHDDRVTSAVFSPDGRRVLTASDDKTARIWDMSELEKGDGFAIACQRLGHNTSLEGVMRRYGLSGLKPICGEHAPLPIDWSKVR